MKEKLNFSQKVLLAMYKSVNRMNQHFKNENFHAVKSEMVLQEHLRKNFTYVKKENYL